MRRYAVPNRAETFRATRSGVALATGKSDWEKALAQHSVSHAFYSTPPWLFPSSSTTGLMPVAMVLPCELQYWIFEQSVHENDEFARHSRDVQSCSRMRSPGTASGSRPTLEPPDAAGATQAGARITTGCDDVSADTPTVDRQTGRVMVQNDVRWTSNDVHDAFSGPAKNPAEFAFEDEPEGKTFINERTAFMRIRPVFRCAVLKFATPCLRPLSS